MSKVTTEYDDQIKASVAQWHIPWDWLYIKSQWYAESLLQPDAKSSAGAMGLCQFMPDTWMDVKVRLRHIIPYDATPFDAKWAIIGGAYYMGIMRSGWSAPRSEDDRAKLARASYNAGFGNILSAQKETTRGGNLPAAADYATIIARLPKITGATNAKQTTDYVARIEKYYQQFKAEEGPSAN